MPKSKKKKRITNLPYLQYNVAGTDEENTVNRQRAGIMPERN
jgi:hypothetical protein